MKKYLLVLASVFLLSVFGVSGVLASDSISPANPTQETPSGPFLSDGQELQPTTALPDSNSALIEFKIVKPVIDVVPVESVKIVVSTPSGRAISPGIVIEIGGRPT